MNVARVAALAGALAFSAAPLAAQVNSIAMRSQRPALEPLRLGGEVVLGTYTGIGGFLVGRYLGGVIGDMMPDAAESTREQIAHWTGLAAGGGAPSARSETRRGRMRSRCSVPAPDTSPRSR